MTNSDGQTAPTATRRLDAVLVAGGKYHDIDFARRELLTLLGEDERVRVRVFEDYANLEAIRAADFLVSYTCDVTPTSAEQQALSDFLTGGGRWYALHGTNSALRFLESGLVDTPDVAPGFSDLLGSRFLAHPPIGRYRVDVAAPDHPLVAGLAAFETTDELYLGEYRDGLEVLLSVEFEGETPGFTRSEWTQAIHPVCYLRPVKQGAVLYLTLGHCRGHFDMNPLLDFWPRVERGSWELPIFYELLRRGIAWAKAAQPVATMHDARHGAN